MSTFSHPFPLPIPQNTKGSELVFLFGMILVMSLIMVGFLVVNLAAPFIKDSLAQPDNTPIKIVVSDYV